MTAQYAPISTSTPRRAMNSHARGLVGTSDRYTGNWYTFPGEFESLSPPCKAAAWLSLHRVSSLAITVPRLTG